MWWSLQARVAVRRGRHDLAGEGRVAGEQRTTPSSPCAIQLIASRGVSLSAFSCAGPPSSGRTAYGRPAQCTCPPPFAASRPHLRNRGEAIGRSRSTAAAVASEEIVGARSVTKCGGRKSHDPQCQKSHDPQGDSERWAPSLSSPVCCDMLKGVPNLCLN